VRCATGGELCAVQRGFVKRGVARRPQAV